MRSSANSLHAPHCPSIDRDRRTVDIAGERRGEKRHEMPNVARLTKVSSRNVLLDELSLRLLRWMQFLNLSRIDAARGDRVHRDAVRAKFAGQCSGPADESGFRGR